MNIDDVVNVLMKQLPNYKKVKLNGISDSDAKAIIAKLNARGIKVKYENGFFVLVKSKGESKTEEQKQEENKAEEKKEQQAESKQEKTEVKTEEKKEEQKQDQKQAQEVKVVEPSESIRVCIRVRRSIIEALQYIYNEANTSLAIRKALVEVLKAHGYNVTEVTGRVTAKPILSVDEVLKKVSGNEQQ